MRFLDIDTGIEFLAEDICNLVCPGIIDKGTKSFIEALPLKLRRYRPIIDENGTLKEVDTLCWLALKFVFNLFGYEKHREFVRWLRKDVVSSATAGTILTASKAHIEDGIISPGEKVGTIRQSLNQTIGLKDTEDFSVKNVPVASRLPASELIVAKLNSLHWFNVINNCQLVSLSEMYYESRFSLVGAPPTLVPAIQDYSLRDDSFSAALLEATYLSFLYKQVSVPLFHSGIDLQNHLLRRRYLDCCQLALENDNISYSDLYFAFVTDADNLFLAQELDIALIFSYLKKHLSFPILRILEGGIFLQALDLCGSIGTLDSQIVSSLRLAYLNWLSILLEEINSSH
ncbi:hypothetical protein F7734_04235 [Scytonema sp. UIC 10036]|uniref:hypothetical protein n=1 Tax=Scytonema sp. UIC 10036 TaxID=2304196 RepID=UPI0012DA6C1A|nr:hypothetical protein [Scytonema sp. UIC 10036]MUG91729.1 hypothetical protein [Scytonema sp. UIC 10036]